MFNTSFDHPDIANVLPYMQTVKYKKGEIILRPFDDTDYMHSVRSGLIKVYSINADGSENIIVLYGKEDLFPLGWIIEKRKQNVYFQAISDCEVYKLPKNIFLAHVKDSPEVSYAVMQKVLEQFYLLSSRVTNLGFKYARERLAYRLLLLAARFGTKEGAAVTFPHINQQDLAATLNISRENTSREITRLEKMGVINYGRTVITILNSKALRKELGEDVTVMFFDEE